MFVFQTFSKLHHSGVVPVIDYYAGVCGYEKLSSCSNMQNRTLQYFLGYMIGWITSYVKRQTEILWLCNRLIHMSAFCVTIQTFTVLRIMFGQEYLNSPLK